MSEQTKTDWWVDNLIRPTLIAAMLTCLMVPLVTVLEWLFGDWDGTYYLVFAFFAGLEGSLSERILKRQGISGYGYLASRGAECLVLLLVLKIASYVPLGLDRLTADALMWSTNINTFLTETDLVLAALFLPLWVGAIQVTKVVRDLDADSADDTPPPDKTSIKYYLWMTRPSPMADRQQCLDLLGELYVWGGVAMLLASMAIHFFVAPSRSLGLPVVLYFGLGVVLLSQGQFSVLRTGWRIQGVPVQQNIGRRWLLWATAFLVGVVLVTLVLPTWYAIGPLRALLGLFSLAFDVLSFLLLLFLFLLALPLSKIMPDVVSEPTPPAFKPETFVPPETTAQGTSPIETIFSAVFWTLILAILAYSVYRFSRERFGALSDAELQATWLGRVWAWLRGLWRQWRTWRQDVQHQLRRRLEQRRDEQAAPDRAPRFFFPGRLSPRERIRYYYLSAAERARRAGQARGEAQTPYEYRASLDERFPDVEPDLGGLTDAFVKARYSPQPVDQEDAEATRPLWERVKNLLRKRQIQP